MQTVRYILFSVSWTNDIDAIKKLNKRKLTKANATLNRHQIQMLFKWKKLNNKLQKA